MWLVEWSVVVAADESQAEQSAPISLETHCLSALIAPRKINSHSRTSIVRLSSEKWCMDLASWRGAATCSAADAVGSVMASAGHQAGARNGHLGPCEESTPRHEYVAGAVPRQAERLRWVTSATCRTRSSRRFCDAPVSHRPNWCCWRKPTQREISRT